MTSPTSYYDGIRREAAAAGRAAIARQLAQVRAAIAARESFEASAQTHCRTCGRDRCSCSDFAWSARA